MRCIRKDDATGRHTDTETDLDTQGIANATQVLQVSAIELPGPFPAPQEVTRAAVPEACCAVLASQRLQAASMQQDQ